jgi:aryl-alcohol dehydrogenase-like predicted oxidoreductase
MRSRPRWRSGRRQRLRLDVIDVYQVHWPIPDADVEEVWSTFAERHGTTAGAIAIAWTLHNSAVDAAVVGLRRPEQVEEPALAGNVALSDDDLATIAG